MSLGEKFGKWIKNGIENTVTDFLNDMAEDVEEWVRGVPGFGGVGKGGPPPGPLSSLGQNRPQDAGGANQTGGTVRSGRGRRHVSRFDQSFLIERTRWPSGRRVSFSVVLEKAPRRSRSGEMVVLGGL